MTKAEFVERVSRKTKLSKAQTARILDTTLGEVQALLKKGDSIAFTGFGTFSVSKRKARKGRHPRTGRADEHLRVQGAALPARQVPEGGREVGPPASGKDRCKTAPPSGGKDRCKTAPPRKVLVYIRHPTAMHCFRLLV